MEALFILVALATVAGAILSIRSAVGVLLDRYSYRLARVTASYGEEKERRRVLENEVWLLKDYQRFQPEFPQPGMSIHTHEIETLETDPVLVYLEANYRNPDDIKQEIRSRFVHAIAKALVSRDLIEIQTRDTMDMAYGSRYNKVMRAIIRVVNPKAKSIEPRVQVPHYGHVDIPPSSTNSRIKRKPK